ncbi:unnamed protein product [Effrenium voratum]|uniref:Uncharacterized protein n=1 Tax=Effrenium voratum TaxID=2562239 RepID=A0AA36I453_9DINO|nr:unnamed protein product [Effrenium voratum]CAJ1436036.1 unnamed protein product [Effrenium voratum]
MAMDCEFPEDWEAVAFEEEVAVDDFEEEPLQEPPELPEGLIEELEEELQEEVLLEAPEALPAEEVDDEELAALEAAACARWEAEGAGEEVEASAVTQAVQRDARSTGPRNLHKEPWKANWAGNRSHDKGKDKGKGNKQKNKNKAWEAFQQRVQAQVRETWPTPRPPPVARGAWIRPPAKGGHLKGAKGGKFPLRGQRVWQDREKGGKGSAGFRAQPRPELSARQAGHQVQPKVAGRDRRVDAGWAQNWAPPGGQKRPSESKGGDAKRAKPEAPEPLHDWESEPQPKERKVQTAKVKLKGSVAEKVQQLAARGVKLKLTALQRLAAAEPGDAAALLQALLARGHVNNPSAFVIGSLELRAAKTAGSLPDQRVQKTIVKAKAQPSAPVKIVKAKAQPPAEAQKILIFDSQSQPLAKIPGLGQPPLPRPKDLDFERLAVEAKLLSLNRQQIWPKRGPHPLDEATLAVLMQIEPARALEILDEVEAQGVQLADPARFARELAADEEKVYPA